MLKATTVSNTLEDNDIINHLKLLIDSQQRTIENLSETIRYLSANK